MGGEVSGHFCFKDYFYCDSGFLAFLILLEEISKSKKKVSGIAKELSPYFKSPEANFLVKDKKETLMVVEGKYQGGENDYLDGVTIQFKDWWLNARPSNTEPLIRITVEADNKKLLEGKMEEIKGLMKAK
jgi:phosphomannomutase